jgi:hypothetical protein
VRWGISGAGLAYLTFPRYGAGLSLTPKRRRWYFRRPSGAQLLPKDFENSAEIADHLIIPKADQTIAQAMSSLLPAVSSSSRSAYWPVSCSAICLTGIQPIAHTTQASRKIAHFI